MVKEGLVASRDDPTDNRRKIFYLISKPVGSSVVPRDDLNKAIGGIVEKSMGSPSAFLKGELRVLVVGVEAIGLNMDPVLKDIGRQIGVQVAKHMVSSEIKDLVDEVKNFFEQHDLGTISVYSLMPLTLIINDECDCSDIPDIGRTLCTLNEGIVEAIFEQKTGMPLRVTQTECFGTNYNYCKFVLEPAMYD